MTLVRSLLLDDWTRYCVLVLVLALSLSRSPFNSLPLQSQVVGLLHVNFFLILDSFCLPLYPSPSLCLLLARSLPPEAGIEHLLLYSRIPL